MTSRQRSQEALERAISSQAFTNIPLIFQGFLAKGLPESEIKPRENVFTFHAWKALGRIVRKGEHGIQVLTFKSCTKKKKEDGTGEEKVETYSLPWSTTVFHISQTEPLKL